MDYEEVINNLNLISSVIPDYSEGRNRGLTDEESERIALEAVQQAIEMLERLEKEKQWLYGKLNMISGIIERGRVESKQL